MAVEKKRSEHFILVSFEDEYRETKDPVWVWHAIDFCASWQKKTGEQAPYPVWVKDYLAEAATRLMHLGSAGEAFAGNMQGILGLTPDAIANSIDIIREKVIFFQIQAVLETGQSVDEAVATVAGSLAVPVEKTRTIYEKYSD